MRRTNTNQSQLFANRAYDLAKHRKDSAQVLESLFNVGISYDIVGDPSKSLIKYKEAERIAKLLHDNRSLAYLTMYKGSATEYQGNYADAIVFFKEALVYMEKSKDSTGLSALWNNIGINYQKASGFAQSVAAFEKGLAYASNNIKRKISFTSTWPILTKP